MCRIKSESHPTSKALLKFTSQYVILLFNIYTNEDAPLRRWHAGEGGREKGVIMIQSTHICSKGPLKEVPEFQNTQCFDDTTTLNTKKELHHAYYRHQCIYMSLIRRLCWHHSTKCMILHRYFNSIVIMLSFRIRTATLVPPHGTSKQLHPNTKETSICSSKKNIGKCL